MTSRQCSCIRRFLAVGLGLLSILAGVYLYLNWIEMFTQMRGKEMALSEKSPAYEGWKVSPLPLNFDVYLFNWTNPEDFYIGSKKKPRFEQLGPYRFREVPDKVDIVWHTNHTVSFRKKAIFYFDQENSNGTLEDKITTVDTVAHSAALRLKNKSSFEQFFFNRGLMAYSKKFYITKTANEWLFAGYQDPFVTIGTYVSKLTSAVEVPFDRIGWLYTRNDSAYYEGHFNMFTGGDDVTKMGQINEWNYKSHNGVFEGECGRVKGSMGEFFPPNLTPQDSVFLYVPNICRAVPLDYTETVSIHGVTAYKYSGTERSVDNVLIITLNGAFITQSNLIENAKIIDNTNFEYTVNQSSEMDSYPNESANRVLKRTEGNKPNLTALTWAHAVNSQRQLTAALEGDIDFIEADIVMGKLNNTGADLPIMAHPPAKTSDLSLESFLRQIKQHNDKNTQDMKGVKLDFKSIEVFEGALQTLKEKIPEMSYPIWLNADIVGGPVNQNVTTPVNPERFFAGCAPFEKAVLSIGWTTKWTSTINNGSYTRNETNAMLEAIKNNNVTKTGQSITFPVRAGIAANSLNELHDLVKAVNATNECSLTIWSSQNDFVNIDKLRKLIFSFGFDRIYLDVPEEVSSKLNLWRPVNDDTNDNNGVSVVLPTLLNFSLISIGMVLISMWLQKAHG